ncbi:hypothetical protein IX307_001186 [Bacteroides pyogenes]|nr:hypothetical protein [Bacteroides pyogenes]MBR8786872.1 hypothetical protein [Bacteroides pyogenes]MBR8792356.1 hypothetical protein [Bacteroides pyogenes]
MILCRRASVKCSTFCAGFFYAHKDMAAAFPNFLALRRYVVIVLRHGKWQPFFCLKAKQSQRMKKTTPGTTYVPSFRSTQNVNTLQERYFRSLSDDSQANFRKKSSRKLCVFKNNPHLCSVFHLKRASRLANCNAGIFYAYCSKYGSVPCGALMRPLPFSGGRQRGAEPLLFPSQSQHIVSR